MPTTKALSLDAARARWSSVAACRAGPGSFKLPPPMQMHPTSGHAGPGSTRSTSAISRRCAMSRSRCLNSACIEATLSRHGAPTSRTVVGVDALDPGADFSAHLNIRVEIADQRDSAGLSEICRRHAPDGFDIIIDDASHFGAFTLMSYLALF